MTKQKWPYKLTLAPNGTRWIKKYKGKQYYCPIPEEVRDNQKRLEKHNRHAWNKWWLPLVGKLKTQEVESEKEVIRDRWNLHMERLSGRLYVAGRLGSREMVLNEILLLYIDEYEIQQGKPLSQEERKAIYDAPQDHLEVFGFIPKEGNPEVYTLPAERREQADAVDSSTNIEALIVRFLQEKESEVVPRRLKLLEGCLVYLQQYVGGGTEFSGISEQTLKDYRGHVLSLMEAGKFGDERAGSLMDTAKQFIRWCVSQSTLVSELDPVVASSIHSLLASRGVLSIKKTRKAVKTSGLREVQGFLASNTSDMIELYTLLAANCSLTPVDIVDVRWTDIKKGVLTYKRHKEREEENVPTVKYPLWKRTQELLERMPKTDERVFPKTAGSVTDLFCYTRNKVGHEELTLGSIKKTSSSMIGEQFNNDLADYWLGHSPNGIGRKHYIAPSDENLAKAVKWLETQYFPAEEGPARDSVGG